MPTSGLTPSRALRPPRKLDLRAVLGIFLTLLAVAGSVAYWTSISDTRAVVVATRELAVGATIADADLGIARVRVDDSIYSAAVPAEDLVSLVGRQLGEPVHAQQLLVRAQVSSRVSLASDQMAMTIGVSPESAAGGQLRPGDAVQVLVTTNKDKPDSKTTVVLPRVAVYDVGYDQGLMVVGAAASGDSAKTQGPLKHVTLVVTGEQAIALAQAKWGGELDVALLPPAQP